MKKESKVQYKYFFNELLRLAVSETWMKQDWKPFQSYAAGLGYNPYIPNDILTIPNFSKWPSLMIWF